MTKHGEHWSQTPLGRFGITGTTVVLEMASGGLFMENVKMEKQRSSQPYPTIMRTILGQGVRGFEAGLLPWGVVLGFTKGAVLGSSKAYFQDYWTSQGYDASQAAYISGPMAGGVQGAFMSPLLLARTRVNQSVSERAARGEAAMTMSAEVRHSFTILNSLVKEEGAAGLARGMPLFVFKRAFDWGTRFAILTYLRDGLKKDHAAQGEAAPKLTQFEKFWTSFMAGALSIPITVPVDRMAPVIQAAGSEAKDGILPYLRRKIAEEGVGTIFRGGIMRTIHTGWHTVFAIFLSDVIAERLSSIA